MLVYVLAGPDGSIDQPTAGQRPIAAG